LSSCHLIVSISVLKKNPLSLTFTSIRVFLVFLIIAGLIIFCSKHVVIQQTKLFPQIKVENALRHVEIYVQQNKMQI
jgi:hypothetical protein